MTLQSKTLAIIVVVFLFGGILLSNAMGWWLTESTKEVSVIAEGDFAGLPNPEDIRGSYTFGDIENNFGIPAALLAKAFVVQVDDPQSFQVKNLETQYAESEVEIGTASVRLFVAYYSGLLLNLSLEESYLPVEAAAILKEQTLTEEQLGYLEDHMVDVNTLVEPVIIESEADIVEEEPVEETDTSVKGKTTFSEVISWGVSEDTIEAILGMPMPEEKLTVIKDFVNENSLDFETIKEALQTAVDVLE